MSFDPDKIYEEVLKAGEDWADKKAAYEALHENTKSILADISGRYLDGKTTKTDADRFALASKDFREHLGEVAKFRKSWLHAQVRYDSLRMLAEHRRTQESSRRAEMKMV